MWEALQSFDESCRLARIGLNEAIQLGDRTFAAMEMGNLGSFCLEAGDITAARRHLTAALTLYRTLGWKTSAALTLSVLGRLELRDRGLEGMNLIEQACTELDRLGASGEWAETRLEIAEELMSIGAGRIGRYCEEAFTRAISIGRIALAERALRLLERC
jgi:hypothetical protein